MRELMYSKVIIIEIMTDNEADEIINELSMNIMIEISLLLTLS